MEDGGADAIAIVTYHSLDTSGSVVSVTPTAFAAHLACLAEVGVRGIALREAVAHRARTGTWPTRCLVLTFDDGYANVYEAAWPILQRYGFTATVFLVTQHIEGSNDWAPPPAGLGARAMLSWQQAAEMAAGGIEIGAHTRTHRDLLQLSNVAAADEILASRRDIESRLAGSVDSFAYPFGRVSAVAEDIVKREFRAGCTTVLRRARHEESARLPRVDAYYLQSVDAVRRLLHGQLDRYLTFRRCGRMVREMLSGV